MVSLSTLSNLRSNTISYNITTASKLATFITLGSNVTLKYSKLCYRRLTDDDRIVCMHNLLDDYVDILEEYFIDVELTPEEVKKYRYNPKRMAYDLYGSTDLYSFILYINKFASVKEFVLDNPNIKLIHVDNLTSFLSTIMSAEQEAIGEPIRS